MSRMIRKQVYIEPKQDEFLKRRSQELGVTEAELIRRAIDESEQAEAQRGIMAAQAARDWTRTQLYEDDDRFRRLARFRPDLCAWQRMKTAIEERMRLDASQTGRDWTREELYDERLNRYSD